MFSSIYDCIYSAVASSATVSVSLYSYNMLFAVLLTSNLVCSKLSPIFNGLDAINFEKSDSLSANDLYAEFADKVALAKDARIVTNGDYVAIVIAGISNPDYSAIDTALETALNF